MEIATMSDLITRSDSGGVLVINSGNPVILKSIHILGGNESGLSTVLSGYIVLRNHLTSEALYKWLAGYPTISKECFYTFGKKGLYIPSLDLVKEAADQVVITWRQP
jgi:hypothetical protein